MMWPILTKGKSVDQILATPADVLVQYEKLPAMFQTVSLWRQIALSAVLNWILGPFVSLVANLVNRLLMVDHASGRMGYITGPTDIQRGSHHGRTRQVCYFPQASMMR